MSAPGEQRRWTVMLTDIEDSTRLWEHHATAMEHVVPGNHELTSEIVARHGGRVLKSTGDGALALFAEAIDAVDAAADVQRTLATHRWPEIGELRLRIGLNTGICKVFDGDVLGRPPNLASRLQAAGHGGQILLSGATADATRAQLGEGTSLQDLGYFLIRGFDEPVAVYTVVADGLRTELPPPRAVWAGSGTLPPDDTLLVGREDATRELVDLVVERRLVTLWGPAGVGKTRLAVRVATLARVPFRDGIHFIDLAAVDDRVGVATAISDALRVQPIVDEDPIDAVRRALHSAHALVVLDNCENSVDGLRPVVDAIVRHCRDCRILAASREPLGVREECLREVRPLQVPSFDATSITELTEVPSVRLFVDRTGIDVTMRNVASVIELCRAADGLPLALELAAAHARIEGLGSEEPFDGLDEALMRTFARLSPSQTRLLCRLSAFSGPFSRQLARGLARDIPRVDVELDRLVRTAMIQREEETETYRILAPTRRFARAQLGPDGRGSASAAHAALMLARAEALGPLMQTAEEANAVATVRAELAEHRAAINWFAANDRRHEATRMVLALFQFFLFQPEPEGHRWAAQLAEHVDDADPLATELLGATAMGMWYLGDVERAISAGRRAVDIAARHGGNVWWARNALVNAYGYAGDLDRLVPHYLALISELSRCDVPFWQVHGSALEAISLSMAGKTRSARERAGVAIAIAQRMQNPSSIHWSFYALGRALATTEPDAACEAFEQAMRASRSVDNRFILGLALVEWVRLKRRMGDRRSAVTGVLDLLDLLALSGNRSQLSQSLREAGMLLADEGRLADGALALLARRGLPAMPTDGIDDVDDIPRLADLEQTLADEWPRIQVRAMALDEPSLIELCRGELGRLRAGLEAG
ncbi:MAG: adenylate/guanylate cyclase domain-containing protein [Ilumatobacteraceae bacterium]